MPSQTLPRWVSRRTGWGQYVMQGSLTPLIWIPQGWSLVPSKWWASETGTTSASEKPPGLSGHLGTGWVLSLSVARDGYFSDSTRFQLLPFSLADLEVHSYWWLMGHTSYRATEPCKASANSYEGTGAVRETTWSCLPTHIWKSLIHSHHFRTNMPCLSAMCQAYRRSC
jgi:hypothetical protein